MIVPGIPEGVQVVDQMIAEVEGGHPAAIANMVWVCMWPVTGGKSEPWILPEGLVPNRAPGTRFGYAVVRDETGSVRGVSYPLEESSFTYEPLV